MKDKVARVTPLPNYRLKIEFQDGVSGTVDLTGELYGEMFEPLRDEAVFRKVRVDEFGAVVWPNGADLAPDALYLDITGRGSEEAPESRAVSNAKPSR